MPASSRPADATIAIFMAVPLDLTGVNNQAITSAPAGLLPQSLIPVRMDACGIAPYVGFRQPREVAMKQFGIGQPIRRVEDRRFLTGHGHYLDDIVRSRQAYAAI